MLFETNRLFLMVKTLISTVMVLSMMAALTKFKYPKGRILIAYGAYLLYALISTAITVIFGGWIFVLKIFMCTLVIPAVVLTYFVAKDHSMQAVFNYMTQINLFMTLSATVTLTNTALHGNEITDLIGRFMLLGGTAIFEYKFLRGPFRKIADSLERNWLPMALIPVAFSILILLCVLFPVNYTKNFWGVVQLYAISIVMIVVYYVVFQSLLKSYHLLEGRLEKDVMNAQLYAQKQYYETLLHRGCEVSDQNNSIKTMLQNKQYEEALKLLEEWSTEHNGMVYCRNTYLNAVAELFAERFKELKIPISFSLEVGRAQLHDAELFLILNNALENALEASLQVPEERRMVNVQSKLVQGQFLIRVRNYFDGKLILSNNLPCSTKKSLGHGYGLSSIRAAAERAEGDMTFHVEKNSFVLDVRTQARPFGE